MKRLALPLVGVLALGAAVVPAAAQDSSTAPPAGVSATDAAPPAPAPQDRKKIGLALGGGAARGIAHIGFLEWLDEHRIPVDYVAGTSMGGLVGGAYATGMTTAEMRELMKATDWDLVFLADSPFKYKDFRRKQDARAFPAQLEFGLKGGFRLPTGLNAGQQIAMLLDGIALHYYDVKDFDQLPTPLRVVATDLRGANQVVMGSGDLARAMRATMAIPGVFTPVIDGDQIFVDGGTLNNVPADVTRAMGADVVIAVNVGASTDAPPPPANMFAILGQTIDTMMQAGVRASLKEADLVVTPPLKGLTGMDWRRSDELADRGYQAAEAMAAELLPYQVDEATYAAWKSARDAKRRTGRPIVAGVRVTGVAPTQERQILERFEQGHIGRPLDPDRLRSDILFVTGSDRYEVIRYRLEETPQGVNLVLNVTPKDHGPPFLLPALDLENLDSNTFSASLRFRLALYDTPIRQTEVRMDVALGSAQAAALEVYRRLGRTGLFVAPRASWRRGTSNAFDEDRNQIAEYSVKRAGVGFDFGYNTSATSELRAGYDWADVRVRREIGEPSLPEAEGAEQIFSLRWTYDGQNSPLVPSRGAFIRGAYRYVADGPDTVNVDGSTLFEIEGLSQVEFFANHARRLGGATGKNRLLTTGSFGTSFGEEAGIYEYRLGGFGRLGAYNNQQVSGDNFILGSGMLLREWFRLPDVLGQRVYYGGGLEVGSAFDNWDTADWDTQMMLGVVLETILGPAFLGGSVSFDNGDTRLYVALAPFMIR
jgi:NTE family protein